MIRKQISLKIFLLVVSLVGLGLFVLYQKPVYAANPTTINFQGKVVNADGTNVANNTYSFTFRLYNNSGTNPNSTTCALEGTCLWEETQASVTVTNGVFQVELGTSCSFFVSNACNKSAPIDFNSSNALYLTMKFNSDAQGYMTPMMHFQSVPYAYNSDKLGGLASSAFGQISANNSWTGTNAIQVASSTALLVQNSSSKGILTVDTSGGQVVLGALGASGVNGKLIFNSATAGNFTTTLVASSSQAASYSLTLPTAAPTGTGQCLQTSGSATQLAFGTCGGGGGTLATSYAAGSSQSDSTMALDSTRLGVILQDAGTPISGNLLAVKAATANGGGNYLAVTASAVTLQDTAGHDALVFDSTTSMLKIYENTTTPTNYLSLYYDNATSSGIISVSSGTLKIGPGSGPITLTAGSGAAITITANAASTWSTTSGGLTIQAAAASTWSTVAGNLTIQGGSGTVSLGTSTILTAGGSLNITSVGTATWSSSSGNLTVQGGAALVLDAAAGSTITIGSGSNYAQFAGTTRELSFAGTARHTRYVTLTAEYPGASMTGDGLNNTGTMTSDNTTSSSSPGYMNYYDWTSTTSGNDYDIWIRVPLPEDWSAWSGSGGTATGHGTAGTEDVVVAFYGTNDPASAICSSDIVTSAGWNVGIATCNYTGGTFSTSGGVFTIRITLRVNTSNNHARIGDIKLPYLSKW